MSTLKCPCGIGYAYRAFVIGNTYFCCDDCRQAAWEDMQEVDA